MDWRPLSGEAPQPDVQEAVPLDQWVAMRGPLWPAVALAIALDACARASRIARSELGDVAGSLNVTRILRSAAGCWQWVPVRVESPASRVGDTEVIARLGALLFHCVTGRALIDPFADEHSVRTRLRSLRPDLPPGVADLTVRALAARRSGPRTLEAFAGDVRQLLGIAHQMERPRSRRTMTVLGAAATASALVVGMWWMSARSNDRIESHGLTKREAAVVDVTEETAQGFAMMDEHTAAIQEYQQLVRWLTPRLAPEDPRLAWNTAHQAWVLTLRGDRFTTEQVLSFGNGATSRLEATLGERHPYTRAVRLELAATLEARKAIDEAAALREKAASSTRDLIAGSLVESDLLEGIPAAPGVLAHTAPNAPELEGFRRRPDGTAFVPLTSIQRLFAGRDGWRLHVIAGGTCRTSAVLGNIPRRITVNIARGLDSSWRVQLEGTRPPLTFDRPAAEKMGISLITDGSGAVQVRLGDGAYSAVVDAASPPPEPPYSFAFDGDPGVNGCTVVWLEIPFPFEPKR